MNNDEGNGNANLFAFFNNFMVIFLMDFLVLIYLFLIEWVELCW